jgi:hypothetical protein
MTLILLYNESDRPLANSGHITYEIYNFLKVH